MNVFFMISTIAFVVLLINGVVSEKLGFGMNCTLNDDCDTGLVCDIRKHPNLKTCLKTNEQSCDKPEDCANNLDCVNKSCVCKNNEIFNQNRKNCVSKQGFGEPCKTQDECRNSLVCSKEEELNNTCLLKKGDICSKDLDCANNLNCLGGKCNCKEIFETYSSKTRSCELARFKGEGTTCNATSDCPSSSSLKLACDNIPNGKQSFVCLRSRLAPCLNSNQCVNRLDCIDSICQCQKNLVYDELNRDCIQKRHLNEQCKENEHCGADLSCNVKFGLINSVNKTYFVCLKNFGSECTSSSECSFNLDCINSTCKCPQYHYYRQDLGYCFADKYFGYPCRNNSECGPHLACDTSPLGRQSNVCLLVEKAKCSGLNDCVNTLECRKGICRCDTNEFWLSEANECKKKLK